MFVLHQMLILVALTIYVSGIFDSLAAALRFSHIWLSNARLQHCMGWHTIRCTMQVSKTNVVQLTGDRFAMIIEAKI